MNIIAYHSLGYYDISILNYVACLNNYNTDIYILIYVQST